MKLYYTKGACSLVVRIIINEIGVKSDYEAVDLKNKKTEHSVDFFSINPKGSVPTLETDDRQILTENAIILQYLADHYKATKLLPPVNDFQRYRVLEALNYIATELHKSFGFLFNPQIPQEVKSAVLIPLIKKKFEHLNKALLKGAYLLGDTMTLPDAYFFVMLLWAKNFSISFAEFSEVTRFFDDLRQRPSVAKSLQEEGLQV